MPSLTPNYLTIDPVTGEVGAVFPGGIAMPAGTGFPIPPPDTRAIRWEASDGSGTLRSFLFTNDNGGGGNQLSMYVMDDPGPLPDFVTMAVADAGGSVLSALEVIETAAGLGEIFAFADRPGGAEQRVILDGNGNSDFIQANNAGAGKTIVQAMAGIAVVAIAAGVAVNSANTDTGLPAAGLSGFRVMGSLLNLDGSRLGWGVTRGADIGGNLALTFQFRNNSAAASAAMTFTPTVLANY